jgi:hypothetical protein
MSEPTPAFIEIQARIMRAKDDLYALSLLASWKKFNEAAAIQLASAASCGGGRRGKVQEDGSRRMERD